MTDSTTEGLGARNRARLMLWAAMAAPGAVLVVLGLAHVKLPYTNLTGLLAGLFLALTLLVTPLQRIVGPLPWLKSRRRYLGVASFGYMVLHLAVWLAKANLQNVLQSFTRPEILLGWLAGAIMLPLAVTSFDGAVRALGRRWKALHRWVYPMAVLVLGHWLWAGDWKRTGIATAVIVIALELWRYSQFRGRATR
jgi:sulfoxide reductase heme-binding subunit YedZ